MAPVACEAKQYNAGDAFKVKVLFQIPAPGWTGEWVDYDPTSPKVTIYNPSGVAVKENQTLVQDVTVDGSTLWVGHYYYYCQSEENWEKGPYRVKGTGQAGTHTALKIEAVAFRLI
jgi:hypothetical protein